MSTYVIKARGLPWSATPSEVTKFFSDVNILNGENGVHFTFNKEGRPSGECFIEVGTEADREAALAHDNEHMGKRYIEIKEAKHTEMEWVVNKMGHEPGNTENIVRLRGLPYGCTKQDIDAFFPGLQIIPHGITLTMDQDGRASGDAYIEFASSSDVEEALKKHKEKMGHRYIEVFRSSRNDIKHVVGQRNFGGGPKFMGQRPGPYDRPNFPRRGAPNLGPSGFNSGGGGGGGGGGRPMRGGRSGPMHHGGRGGRMGGGSMGGGPSSNMPQTASKTGHCVHLRGLPFEATTKDVNNFFAPLNPVDIRILYDQVSGRAKGECDVDFSTHADAEAAMQKDKQNIGHRYIELFLQSSPMGGSGGGWSNNDMSGGNDVAPLMGSTNRPPSLMSSGGAPQQNYSQNSYNQYGGGYNNSQQNSGGYGGQPNNQGYNAGNQGYGTGGYNQPSGGGMNNMSYPAVQQSGGTGNNYYGSMR